MTLLNPTLTVDDADDEHSTHINNDTNNTEEVVTHDPVNQTYTILTEFEKQRKRMYCKLPQISHRTVDVPVEANFCQATQTP